MDLTTFSNNEDNTKGFETTNTIVWNIIDSYFKENPSCLVAHHLDSYNDFYKKGIYKIFQEKNPVKIYSMYDENIKDYRHKCEMYFGGKEGNKIYFGKPNIQDKENPHYMFPNEARIRNMDYSMTIHYDVDIEFKDILKEGEEPTPVVTNQIDDYTKHLITRKKNEFEDNENEEDDDGEFKGGDEQEGGGAKKKKTVLIQTSLAKLIREETEKSVDNKGVQTRTMSLHKIYLGKFPIMVQSEFCILNGLPREIRFNMGECKNDLGGYFIIGGKEKVIVPQETFANNMLYIRKYGNTDEEQNDNATNPDVEYLCSAEIRSVSENSSKPIRTFSIRLVAPTAQYTNNNIVVVIPNVRKPIPLFIVFRALGIISDKDIIKMCLLDIKKYEFMLDLFIPSIHDAGTIFTQTNALKYIASFIKEKTTTHALEILMDYFLPHVGESNFIEKAYYLGHMVFHLLLVYSGLEQPTDRDNFKYKRIELVGSLLYDLFREYYTIQQKTIYKNFEQILYYHPQKYEDNLMALIEDNYRDAFIERNVEDGFKKAYKGNWGAYSHTKRIGIVQDMNRLSFNTMISHLRKTNLPIDSSLKIVKPRLLHNSQWGFIDFIDTPDGGNIGLHKNLAITTQVTSGFSREPIIQWMRENVPLHLLNTCTPEEISFLTKVFVNGYWAGCVNDPINTVEKMKLYRRNSLLPIHTSITFNIQTNTIYIYTDDGRLCRPIFYIETNKKSSKKTLSFQKNKDILQSLKTGDFHWHELVSGFNKKNKDVILTNGEIYTTNELYGVSNPKTEEEMRPFIEKKAIIDLIDSSETEDMMIASSMDDIINKPLIKYTHCEIHHSLLFGVMCNQIAFTENNPFPRDLFSTGQSKQACSLYHTNYQVRMDKTAVVLNYGQKPIVKSRYLKYINNEENPYGENAIVAVMCFTGYNVEDAILINEASIQRGLFRTTYFTTYETHEEKSKEGDMNTVDKHFTNIEKEATVIGTKAGYDYSKLDDNGMIREGTVVTDKTILIGLTSNSGNNDGVRVDLSIKPKKGQIGVVDKTFITEGEQGERIAKVRVCEQRIPNLGDKFASTVGQKGTIGMVIPERDMPFTIHGIRPDLIINPHALPSRMTIGQLISSITGKACLLYGGFGDCTAFNQNGTKVLFYGEQLTNAMDTNKYIETDLLKNGFHSSGNEILYDGMTGEQIESEIFIGPTYYMRLKHMVKDKINYRALGPRSVLTRQPIGGRANDGGLRIGEMEKDSIVSHGMSAFLNDSMMERGDKYKLAICNQSGMIAIYNASKNLFVSPMIDGPVQFTNTIDLNDATIDNSITRFGKQFSIVSIPYSFKLLMQELQAVNIQMRIITEDNINQFENLSFSSAFHSKKIINTIKKRIENNTDFVNNEFLEEDDKNNIGVIEGGKKNQPIMEIANEPIVEIMQLKTFEEPELQLHLDEITHPFSNNENKEQLITNTPFTLESFVYMRNDVKPYRIWKIKNITPSFFTIETDDMEGLINNVKVVSKEEIYPVATSNVGFNKIPFHYGVQQMQSQIYPETFQPFQQQQPMFSSSPIPPTNNGGITFAPTIKVLNNATDNSTTSGNDDTITTTSPMSIPNIQKEKIQNNNKDNNDVNNNVKKPFMEGGSVGTPTSAPTENKTIFGGLSDFANIVVNKIM